MDNDKPSPIFPSCNNCIHLNVCSAIKASKAIKEQWTLEYPYVTLPDSLFDLAKYCVHYLPANDVKFLPKEKQEFGV